MATRNWNNVTVLWLLLVVVCSLNAQQDDSGYITAQPQSVLHLFQAKLAQLSVYPADATCSQGSYCDVDNPTSPFRCVECSFLFPQLQHNLSFILDSGGLSTFWQSRGWTEYPKPFDVTITLSFRKLFRFEQDVRIFFNDGHFPSQMILEKSLDMGKTWHAMEYYSTNCTQDFDLEEKTISQISNETEVICSSPYQYQSSQAIVFSLRARYSLLAGIDGSYSINLRNRIENDPTFRNFFSFTDLRLRLMKPYRADELGDPAPVFIDEDLYSYAISHIEFYAGCECNLHGDYCYLDVGTDQVVCNCLHNTEGTSCDRCTFGYQGLPWQAASYFPYPDGSANECVETPTTTTMKVTTMGTTAGTDMMTELMTEMGTTIQITEGQPLPDSSVCDEDPYPCNNGMCVPQFTALGFLCVCDPGYSGFRCEKYSDPCRGNPCPRSQPFCKSYGGVSYDCFTRNEFFNITEIPLPPDYFSWITITTFSVGTLTLPLFCVIIVLLLYFTTWQHLHPKPLYGSEYVENWGTRYYDNYFSNKHSAIYIKGENPKYGHLRDRWTILAERLTLGKILFTGEFSYVCTGKLKSEEDDTETKVAVKIARDAGDKFTAAELKTEFEVLGNVGRHPNIVFLMGICYKLIQEKRQMCLVMQYVSRGDLLHILWRCRSRRKDQKPLDPLPAFELLSFGMDIAKGMRHLSTYNYVHQGLCARNVVITFNNKAKLCDFSASTKVKNKHEVIPFLEPRKVMMKRWMAYEAVIEKKYCLKSDVWSFGVLMWEIATLGGIPFHNIKDEAVPKAIACHERMEWPRHISQSLHDMMLRCWHRSPESRPNFDLLFKEMKEFVRHPKRHIILHDYHFNVYVPARPPDSTWEKMQDSFV